MVRHIPYGDYPGNHPQNLDLTPQIPHGTLVTKRPHIGRYERQVNEIKDFHIFQKSDFI